MTTVGFIESENRISSSSVCFLVEGVEKVGKYGNSSYSGDPR
jgi:hypothetical protein